MPEISTRAKLNTRPVSPRGKKLTRARKAPVVLLAAVVPAQLPVVEPVLLLLLARPLVAPLLAYPRRTSAATDNAP